MKRPAATADTLGRIRAWRHICPDLTIRSTFIVGFPGETEQEFTELLEFLEEAQLDRVGCFTYSPVDGAKANSLPNPIPEELKQERYARFMETQATISASRLRSKIGGKLEVLIDEVNDEGAVGRGHADAPEIDGRVFLDSERTLQVGERVFARIESASDHDLSGWVV